MTLILYFVISYLASYFRVVVKFLSCEAGESSKYFLNRPESWKILLGFGDFSKKAFDGKLSPASPYVSYVGVT